MNILFAITMLGQGYGKKAAAQGGLYRVVITSQKSWPVQMNALLVFLP